MTKKLFHLLALCALLLPSGQAKAVHAPADIAESYAGSTITEKGAWCWFADPRALHYENTAGTINSSYVGYIDVHGNIKAMQMDFLTGTWKEVLIRSYFQPDDHDNPTFLVLPDERVMIFYSRHTDEACFYYRISKKPGDITSLGEEKKILTSHNTTYPSPFILSDDPDHIYLCWRGINWHPTIAKLSIPDANDNTAFTWGPHQIVQSTGARPYAKYLSNGTDKLYLTYTTGHPDNEEPNFVYFNAININTLQLEDVKGNILSTIANGTFNVNKTASYVNTYPNTVVDNSSSRDWVWQVAQDQEGNPAIAMVRINGGKTSHDYYHATWTGSEWKKTFLANGGGHFHQTPNLEMCYSGGMALDPENPNDIYCSVPVQGTSGKIYEIIKYTVDKNTGAVTSTPITYNSTKNNSRPYMLPGSENSQVRLVWMHGDYYDWIVSSTRPKGYPTAIHGDFILPENPVTPEQSLQEGRLIDEDFTTYIGEGAQAEKGVLVTTPESFATFELPDVLNNAFTISFSPYLYEGAYSGTLFQMSNLSYHLDAVTLKPYLILGETMYHSTNVLGTSDCWQQQGRGTGGQWYTPDTHKYFNLTFTYADGVLTVLINGLIDQVIETEGLQAESLTLGGFFGWIEDFRLYNRVLNLDEIRMLTEYSTAYTLDSELLREIELNALNVPQSAVSDIVLPTKTNSGTTISWVSSQSQIISNSGLVNLPSVTTSVTLTATINGLSKAFEVTVLPRDITNNRMLAYDFEASDVYTQEGIRYVTDKSGNGLDAAVYGNAQIDGTLDLTANTVTGFSTNGYALVPSGILEKLRSYTFFLKVNPSSLAQQPRLYDFGSASSNSVFGRASKLTAGVKYNGGSTRMVDSPSTLPLNTNTYLAFTFDAKTATTKIYINGVESASGTTITQEPYTVASIGSDRRNYIGRTQWWDSSVASDNIDYKGTIDNFRLFNIALTQEEIFELQNPTSLESIPTNREISCYPSLVPRHGTTQILYDFTPEEMQNLKLEIFDTKGAIIQSQTPSASPVFIKGLQESGVYFIHLTTGTRQKMTGKLMVK